MSQVRSLERDSRRPLLPLIGDQHWRLLGASQPDGSSFSALAAAFPRGSSGLDISEEQLDQADRTGSLTVIAGESPAKSYPSGDDCKMLASVHQNAPDELSTCDSQSDPMIDISRQ
jgi:hypothetical protein